MESTGFVIVVGASAGGMKAFKELLAQIKGKLNAAIVIVPHLSSYNNEAFLLNQLQSVSNWPCVLVKNEIPIQRGMVYLASPDRHLLIKDHVIVTGNGAKENGWRPSIDVLFRSAAVNYNSRSIGIILTGLLNDGTSGMMAVKRSGGTTIILDPQEAEYPQMPQSVLEYVEVDYKIKMNEMGAIIGKILSTNPAPVTPSFDLQREAELAGQVATRIDEVAQLGEHTVYTCPDCGGGLWKISEGKLNRYRCHVGHSFTEDDLEIKQAQGVEATLWVALRMMEERRNLLLKLADQHQRKGLERVSKANALKAAEMAAHINQLREVLFASQNNAKTDDLPGLSTMGE